jgi:hypothetical protein
MKTYVLTISLFFSLINYAQTYNDTLVTTSDDTIFCKITYVNEFNVFYVYNPKRKVIKKSNINREFISFFTVSDTSVFVMEQEIPPVFVEPEKYSYKEANGVIYGIKYDSPPVYGNGLPALNNFITQNTKVATFDKRAFYGQIASVLFVIQIDSLGFIQEVETAQESSTGTINYNSRHMELELIRVLKLTHKWRPASINNKPVSCTVFLPLKFQLDLNSIILYPSRNTFSLKNRE